MIRYTYFFIAPSYMEKSLLLIQMRVRYTHFVYYYTVDFATRRSLCQQRKCVCVCVYFNLVPHFELLIPEGLFVAAKQKRAFSISDDSSQNEIFSILYQCPCQCGARTITIIHINPSMCGFNGVLLSLNRNIHLSCRGI